MKPADEDLWLRQRTELTVDETGREFLAFLEEWLDGAERAMELDSDLQPADAFRSTFAGVEQSRGRIACAYVGQMLVVAISHWEHGHAISDSLTVIERRLMEDTILLKLAELEKQADEEPEEPKRLIEEIPLLQDE